MNKLLSPSISKSSSLNSLIENDESEKYITQSKYMDEIIAIRQILQTIETTNPIINRIYKDVKKYIELNCDHSIIHDYVDLDPDNGGQPIKYCEYCYKTL